MIIDRHEPIHAYFGLSYSSHLVIEPARVALLPQPRQQELTAMLDQLRRSFPDVNPLGDQTLAVAGQEYECGDLDDAQMRAAEMTTSDGLDDHTGCEHDDEDDENRSCQRDQTHWYDWRADEYDRWERVVVPSEDLRQARAAGRVVVSRTLLQSMPTDWQHRFVALLYQYDAVDHHDPESYDIRFYTTTGSRTTDPIPHYNRGRTQLVPTVAAS